MNSHTVFLCMAVLIASNLQQSRAAKACSDVQPGDFPCAMEKNWGKCGESWMVSGDFCELSCGRCAVAAEEEEDEAEPVNSVKDVPAAEAEKVVESDSPLPSADGDIIKVGEANFEIEAPKTIEQVAGTESFKGFETECETVLGTLKNVPDASIAYKLLNGLKEADEELHDELDDDDTQYTLFVPLDSAFEEYIELTEGMDDPELQRKILLEHISPVIYHTGMMEEGQDLDTLGKVPIAVESLAPSEITLTKGKVAADIVLSNIWACKSMIHLVDNVLAA